MDRKVATALKKALRAQAANAMKKHWEEEEAPAEPDEPTEEELKRLRLGRELYALCNSFGCYSTQAQRLIETLLEATGTDIELLKEETEGKFQKGEWVVPEGNPNSHNYGVGKPVVLLIPDRSGWMGFNYQGGRHPNQGNIGNYLPMDDSRKGVRSVTSKGYFQPREDSTTVRYATQEEVEAYIKKLKPEVVAALFAEMNRYKLL